MDEFSLRSVWGELVLAVERTVRPVTPEEEHLARLALLELRHGVEANERSTASLLQSIESALFGSGSSSSNAEQLARVQHELLLGRVRVRRRVIDSLADRPSIDLSNLPAPPKPKEDTSTFFELRLVDEVGQAISGVDVEFTFGGETRAISTNPAGVSTLEGVQSASAKAGVSDPIPLEQALEPRWQKPRTRTQPKEGNTQEITFEGAAIAPVAIKPVVPNTILLKPPLGLVFVELWDKSGRVRHADCEYRIEGPETFSGKTDALGQLRHDNVFPGDYQLTLTVTQFPGEPEEQRDEYESPLVVLAPGTSTPELRRLGVVPYSVLARMQLFFNTNKAFLLPTALPSVGRLRALYIQNNPSELLVVGHADTAGDAPFNDKLSLERAQATVAFLKDDVDAWLAFYESGVPEKKRWGSPEDRMMLVAMPDFVTKPKGTDAVRWFQTTRGLTVDGKCGPQTRRQLVTEYMGLDGASLSAAGIEIRATAHGCGENFPLDESGKQLDAEPADNQRDAADRRVELFFFDPEFGILPKPPTENSKAGSKEYPQWRASAIEEHNLAEDFAGPRVTFVELVDALFRTNSAVVLPEGSAPSGQNGEPVRASAASVFGTALRFNQSRPGKALFVAGHTDTVGSEGSNQKLSEERAQCALALLLGGDEQRDNFTSICHARHKVADYKQILAWVSGAFIDLTFDCHPGVIDDNAANGVESVRRFQRAYNKNKSALGASSADLTDDGDVGRLTWGAFFDCYEFSLRRELAEDAAGVKALRDALVFVDTERKALGFGEHFPVEELGVDNFRSQSNRRVELLFFDPGEEPDLVAAQNDPQTADVYLPGGYVRVSVEVPTVRATLSAFLFDDQKQRMPDTPYELRTGLQVRNNTTDAEGRLLETDVLLPRNASLAWGRAAPEPAVRFEDRLDTAPMEWLRAPKTIEGKFRFHRTLFLDVREQTVVDVDFEAERRLLNLGYNQRTLQEKVSAFQRDYAIKPAPWFHAPTRDRLFSVHREGIEMEIAPEPKPPDPPQGDPEDGSPPAVDPADVDTGE